MPPIRTLSSLVFCLICLAVSAQATSPTEALQQNLDKDLDALRDPASLDPHGALFEENQLPHQPVQPPVAPSDLNESYIPTLAGTLDEARAVADHVVDEALAYVPVPSHCGVEGYDGTGLEANFDPQSMHLYVTLLPSGRGIGMETPIGAPGAPGGIHIGICPPPAVPIPTLSGPMDIDLFEPR